MIYIETKDAKASRRKKIMVEKGLAALTYGLIKQLNIQ